MRRQLMFALLAILALVPAGLDAQAHAFRFLGAGRPRIGVAVETRANPEQDKVGARILEVTPDSPAGKAGLQAGDIITRFNGTSLGEAKSDDDDRSGPGLRLIELAQALNPGDTVEVEYRRANDTRKATLVAADLKGMAGGDWHFDMRGGPELPRMMMGLDRLGDLDFMGERRIGGLDLVTLNPDLGEYFGTKEGVLVVRTPIDSTLPLKGGDVILSIDGRKPQSAGHATRILGSYDQGEVVKLEMLRKQKRTTLTWTVPEGRERHWKMDGPHRERPESGKS